MNWLTCKSYTHWLTCKSYNPAYLRKLSIMLSCASYCSLARASIYSLARVYQAHLLERSKSLLACLSLIRSLARAFNPLTCQSFHSRLQIQSRAVQGEGGLCSLLSPCLLLPQIFLPLPIPAICYWPPGS